MRNPHIARLDRQLRLHGEPIQLVREALAVQRHRLNLRGIIKTYGSQQLVGSITQTNYLIIISPTDLKKKGWPGAIPATIPTGTVPGKDDSIPEKGTDVLWMRNAKKSISQVDAIYEGGEVVRIEMRVLG
jgi:hypothetical protein